MNKKLVEDKINQLREKGNEEWNHQYYLFDDIKTRDTDIKSLGYNIPKWERLDPIIEELINDSTTFLDVGCSDGFFCINIAKKNVEKVVGLDLDPLRIERSNFIKSFFNLDNVEFRVQNLYDVIGKESFDVVMGLGLLHRVPDIDDCISKICDASNKFVIFEFKTLIGKKDEIVFHDEKTKSNNLNKLYGTPTIRYVANRLIENKFSIMKILEDTTGNLRYPRTIVVGKVNNE
jgi:SAM-dependent methyltransferase